MVSLVHLWFSQEKRGWTMDTFVLHSRHIKRLWWHDTCACVCMPVTQTSFILTTGAVKWPITDTADLEHPYLGIAFVAFIQHRNQSSATAWKYLWPRQQVLLLWDRWLCRISKKCEQLEKQHSHHKNILLVNEYENKFFLYSINYNLEFLCGQSLNSLGLLVWFWT